MQRFDPPQRQREHAVPDAEELLRLLAKLATDAERVEAERQEAERLEAIRRRDAQVRARIADRAEALYIISIAARLSDMHPQTLRKYDREGLVRPSRSQGSRRLYSDDDLERLQIVRRLTEDLGLNLAAVSLILSLVVQMKSMLRVLRSIHPSQRSDAVLAVEEQIKMIIRHLGVED